MFLAVFIFFLQSKHILFPGTSTVASKYEELECLYAAVGKVIYEGLTNYEKATTNTNPTQLFGKTSSSFFCFNFSRFSSITTFPLSYPLPSSHKIK